ncbi:MAG: uracil phosphoribosyltransferase [Chthoniobacterales bacterium]
MKSLTVSDHALVVTKLAILRAKTTAPDEFRRTLQDLTALLFAEASRSWETRAIEIETPLTRCRGAVLERAITLVPILRAGLGMLDAIIRIVPEANVGHIGIYRDEETLRPVSYFTRLPVNLATSHTLLLDPMLATGNSACEAASILKANGATQIQFICIVSCPQGVERFQSEHPDVAILTAAVDVELNANGYIVPGLGDAGDRYFGTG